MLGDKIASTIVAQSADVPTIKWNGTGVTLGDLVQPGEVCACHVSGGPGMDVGCWGRRSFAHAMYGWRPAPPPRPQSQTHEHTYPKSEDGDLSNNKRKMMTGSKSTERHA
jgi:hypothetical protein